IDPMRLQQRAASLSTAAATSTSTHAEVTGRTAAAPSSTPAALTGELGQMKMRNSRHCKAWLISLSLGTLVSLSSALSQQPSKETEQLRETSHPLYRAGEYALALRSAEQALPLVIREFGPEHEQTSIQYYSLGLTAEKAGNLAAAERYYAETL